MLEPKTDEIGLATVATDVIDMSQSRTLESLQATLYPTFGHRSPDGRDWYVGVSGVVFRGARNNLRRKMMVRVLQRMLRVSASELRSETFQHRVDQFLVVPEKGLRFSICQDGQRFELRRPSRRNGHFRGSFRPPTEHGEISTDAGRIRFGLEPASHFGNLVSEGEAQLIGPTGVSVISDIDDTIKLSDVANRRNLLRNTFLKEFQPVPGMAELYRNWERDGAAFHYVSSSPWQLFGCLNDFRVSCGFPWGSFHLRAIRLRDPSILKLFVARRATKRRVIRSIVRMFPQRKFILVGDSGERDPEIYGAIARKFPQQVMRILIRRVEGKSASHERLSRAFRDLPSERWQLFDSTDELTDLAVCSA